MTDKVLATYEGQQEIAETTKETQYKALASAGAFFMEI